MYYVLYILTYVLSGCFTHYWSGVLKSLFLIVQLFHPISCLFISPWNITLIISCSHCFQESMFVFLFQINYDVSWCGSLEFILLSVHWASWMLILMPVIKFRKLSGIISSNILSAFPPASHLGVHNMYVGPLDVARLCSPFFNF